MSQTPFGEVVLTTEGIRMPMRFPGQYADVESGLNYNYFRDYDPSTGRYVSADPIGLWGGPNSYSFVHNRAMNAIDPFGLTESLSQLMDSNGVVGQCEAKESGPFNRSNIPSNATLCQYGECYYFDVPGTEVDFGAEWRRRTGINARSLDVSLADLPLMFRRGGLPILIDMLLSATKHTVLAEYREFTVYQDYFVTVRKVYDTLGSRTEDIEVLRTRVVRREEEDEPFRIH